jgi:lipopolysaccharide transport system permease protein
MSKSIENTVVYSSDSEVKRLSFLLKNMISDLIASRQLAYTLMTRDIKAQYRQSLLGIIWAFIPAIVTAATFTLASQSKLINLGTTDIPYPAYIIFSTALWQTFSESLLSPINGVIAAKDILSKIKFPREAIILARIGEVIFGTGLGMLLAPLNVLYSDISRGVAIMMGFALFLTPVVFPMPEGDGFFATIVHYNPVTYFLVGIRELTLNGTLVYNTVYIALTAFNIILFFLSWLFYRLSMPFIIERAS